MLRKRILALTAVALLIVSLAACSKKSDDTQENTSENTAVTDDMQTENEQTEDDAAQENAVTETTAADDQPVSDTTDSNTSGTDQDNSATQSSGTAHTSASSTAATAPSQPVTPTEPETQAVTAPAEAPVEEQTAAVKLSDVWDAMTAQMGELPSLTTMTAADAATWYGIDASWLTDCVFKMPAMSVQATEFFMAKVTDGNMDAVKAACVTRQETLAEKWSMYLPAQGELVDHYQLVVSGDYILFCVTEYADTAVSVFQTEVG